MKGSFKFIHCADLHLGSGFCGLSKKDVELGNRMRESVFQALDNIVRLSEKENVDFVIFSGDIFDDTNETPLARSRFVKALMRIKRPCYVCYGNHDHIRKWDDSIPLPDNAFAFPDEPKSFEFTKDGQTVANIIGASFSQSRRTEDITDGISGKDGVFNIGVFHCNLDSCSQDDVYAPCSESSLRSKNIDYWALGHIHKRSIVSKSPYIVYPGNTQGRKITESGPKGCYVVCVTNGTVTDMRFYRTGNISFEELSIDITEKENFLDAIKSSSEKIAKDSMIRVTIRGRGPLDKVARLDYNGTKELIENITKCHVVGMSVASSPEIDLAARAETGDFISAVISYSKKISVLDRERLLDMICSTNASQSIRDRFEQFSDEQLRKMLVDAQYLIIDKMEAKR